jgi:class 3 adenylate cyclase
LYGGTTISETSEQRAILFADVCGSTSIYEAVGDAKALALINSVFKALDKEVNANGGVTVKTLGDGMVCQFRQADAAFRAACGMQEATAKVDAKGKQGLRIKVGYTFGPVLIKDRDVFGDTVNVCARLVSLANPGQVLTTRQTVESLSTELRERCRELYATKVRGRTTEVTVCEVLWRTDPDTTRVNDLGGASAQTTWTWVLKLTYAGETFVADEASVVRIGREKGNEVVVPTDNASRLHARVFCRDGHFFIADQSTNGTFLMVDGTTREVRLRRGEAVLGERGWIGLGKSAASHGDHVLRYRLERSS